MNWIIKTRHISILVRPLRQWCIRFIRVIYTSSNERWSPKSVKLIWNKKYNQYIIYTSIFQDSHLKLYVSCISMWHSRVHLSLQSMFVLYFQILYKISEEETILIRTYLCLKYYKINFNKQVKIQKAIIDWLRQINKKTKKITYN